MAKKTANYTIRILSGTQEPYSIPDGVTEALIHCLGFEYTQARNCEQVIMTKGAYSVYHTTDLERGKLMMEELEQEGLRCVLLHR